MPQGNGTVICFLPYISLWNRQSSFANGLESLLEIIIEKQCSFINYLNILTMQHYLTYQYFTRSRTEPLKYQVQKSALPPISITCHIKQQMPVDTSWNLKTKVEARLKQALLPDWQTSLDFHQTPSSFRLSTLLL